MLNMWKLNDQFFTSQPHQLTLFFDVSGGKRAFSVISLQLQLVMGLTGAKGSFLFIVPLVFCHTSQLSRAKKKLSKCRKKNEEVKE